METKKKYRNPKSQLLVTWGETQSSGVWIKANWSQWEVFHWLSNWALGQVPTEGRPQISNIMWYSNFSILWPYATATKNFQGPSHSFFPCPPPPCSYKKGRMVIALFRPVMTSRLRPLWSWIFNGQIPELKRGNIRQDSRHPKLKCNTVKGHSPCYIAWPQLLSSVTLHNVKHQQQN